MCFDLYRHLPCSTTIPRVLSTTAFPRLLSPCPRSRRLTMSTSTSTNTPTPDEQWKKRSVVSSFIFNLDTPDGKPKVALFRRSGKVSTYQHHLAPISGTIDKSDPTPLSAAWREISEETTLTPSCLTLLRQGKPFTFQDPSIRRQWTVYPFAFRLRWSDSSDTSCKDPSIQIKTDWEHESWEWYDPLAVEDSESFGGVPRLNESLRRVWFEKDLGEQAGRILSEGLDRLAHDFTSGARQMAGDALRILADVIGALPAKKSDNNNNLEKWWTNVRFAAWHIWKNGRESMGAAIMSALLAALSEIEQNIVTPRVDDPESRTRTSVSIIDRQISSRNESASLVSQNLARYVKSILPSLSSSASSSHRTSSDANHQAPEEQKQQQKQLSILTLSESSTISQSLSNLLKTCSPNLGVIRLDIRILESRPLFEGVSLASKLVDVLHDDDDGVVPSPSRSPPDTSDHHNNNNHRITLYTDASAALASRDVDLVLVGADRVSSTGDVSNKTGTLPAVLSARHVTSSSSESRSPAKILVLTESDKIAPSSSSSSSSSSDPNPGEEQSSASRPENQGILESGDPSQVTQSWQTASSRIQAAANKLISSITTTDNSNSNSNSNSNNQNKSSRSMSHQNTKKHEAEAGTEDQTSAKKKTNSKVQVQVQNISFEWCPAELIDGYITEKGEWSVNNIAEHSALLGREETRIFGDL